MTASSRRDDARDPLPLVALLGPTGAGKSKLAHAVAQYIDLEIISCDSVQLYRHFDIGSAKPTAVERAQVTHHLVDVREWNEPADAAWYASAAEQAVGSIASRDRVALMVGGTGLYFQAYRDGLLDVPPVPASLRRTLAETEQANPGSNWSRLLALDPEAVTTVDRHNPVRVQRALEIALLTGQPPSRLRREHAARAPLRPAELFVLEPEAEALRRSIRRRVFAMLEAGLVHETAQLLARGVPTTCPPMRSVGYRQVVEVLSGSADPTQLDEAIERATWGYARRQRTWWRREPKVTYLDGGPADVEVLVSALARARGAR